MASSPANTPGNSSSPNISKYGFSNPNNVETPSPNIRGRARKPNFTNEEIDCLLELVYQSRAILLSNNHKAHNMRHKQVLWQQIADDVTLNGDRLCQRDATDVRQKWKDLLRMAKQDLNAVEAARKNNAQMPPVSPYSNRVIQIKTGTPLFTDPSEDIHGSDFFAAISLLNNGSSGDHEMGEINIKRQADGLEGVDADSNRLASTLGRKPNFSATEIRCLITLYDKHKSILQNESNDTTTTAEKLETWKTIAETVSQTGTERTSAECHQKWQKFVAQAKKEEHVENEEAEKGRSFPKSQFTDLILKVDRTEDLVVESMGFADEFWDSLEDSTENGLSNNESVAMAEFMDEEETLRGLCNIKKEAMNDDDDVLKEANGEHTDGEGTTPSSSTPAATSVQSRPLKRTLSPKASRPDLPRKRKRPLSSFINSSRLQMLQSARSHNGTGAINVTLNHHKEKQDLENRRLRLEVEKLELENAVIRSQQEKLELEKEKLRLEMDKLEQEKEKVNMEKEMVAMNVQVLSQKLETYEN